ncbi:hypothetical protein CLV45_2883 [Hymenobacter chitinivorans DSM 11115]|uniref:Uncharacterized protein n=1 Tax=Hymenobacter chitinivorans DSM 11115 TaxID=1121954 RepID=A0A2M9B9B4_9BACT|nr:hypothetical protein CLV45_2883 [Hymenobacter chitinivorans DSM 11115]
MLELSLSILFVILFSIVMLLFSKARNRASVIGAAECG